MSVVHPARRPRAARRSTLVVAVAALGAAVFAAAPLAYAQQGPVLLGTADTFAVLAGSGITNTGPTTVTGDIGTFPTPSQTGFGSITQTGANHVDDAVTQGAKNDLVTAYNDAAGRLPVTNVAAELGGTTLAGGVYTSPTLGLTGTLTLDGGGNPDAEFIFQTGSTLVTATDSQILLVNGANACHVVWQVGSSATFGTRTQFVGDVLAQTSITAVTGATFQGRLLARDGAVTLDTNTITRTTCPAPTPGDGTDGTDGDGTGGSTTDGSDGTAGTGAGSTGDFAPSGGTGPGSATGGSNSRQVAQGSSELARTGSDLGVRTIAAAALVVLGAAMATVSLGESPRTASRRRGAGA